MIHVYHATPYNPGARGPDLIAEVTNFPDGFVKVAEVDTDDLEIAWERTNTIEQAWILNSGVKLSDALVEQVADAGAMLGGGCRSTSMGDVMVKEDRIGLESGEAFVAVAMGFESIGLYVEPSPSPDSGTVEVEVPVQVSKYQSAEPYQILLARPGGEVVESWSFTNELMAPDLEEIIEAFEKDVTQATIEMVQQAEVDFKNKSRELREEASND